MGLGSFLGCVFSYPLAVSVRSIIETGPRQLATDVFQNNYRKALWFFWKGKSASILWGGFYKTYFYKQFPRIFLVS